MELKESLPDSFGTTFSSKVIRHAFVRKVMFILTAQLCFTAAVVAPFTLVKEIQIFVQEHFYIYWLSLAVFIISYFTLICCSEARRLFPLNLILLAVFTAAFSYMAAMISSFYGTYIVLLSVGLTAGITLLLTLFAVQTKYDFTGCGMFLCVASLLVVMFGLVAMIISIFTVIPILQLVYAALITLLFSMYLVYDIQQIVGGRKHELSPEEYILAALVLYIDIMEIFLSILQLVAAFDD